MSVSEETTEIIAERNAYQFLTRKEIEDLLTQRDIAFSEEQTKSELIELLIGG